MTTPHDFLAAPMPRNLRVRASLQVANTRLPAQSFVLLMALVLLAGIAIARGADLIGTAQAASVLAALGITVLEGRWWGYSSAALGRVLLTHLTRAGRLELEARFVALRPENTFEQPLQRPRWRQERDGAERTGVAR
jgi:hypothetical protein